MKISFLTSGHLPYDDRIYWHMGMTLARTGQNTEIISSKLNLKETSEGILINCFDGEKLTKASKTEHFILLLEQSSPDIIICSEPLPVIAARRYCRRSERKVYVIYDITEWYPSGKNLEPYHRLLHWLVFIRLLAFNLAAAFTADAFIFGEWYKSRPYRLLFPFKRYLFLTYYPDLKYLQKTEPHHPADRLNLVYAGRISIGKGYANLFNAIKSLSQIKPDLLIHLKIIGWYETENDRQECESFIAPCHNLSVEIRERQAFTDFITEIKNADLFLDLRVINFESTRSLPIKLFYYAALGRPVIFSDLKSIRHEAETENFGFLVKPDNPITVAKLIACYTENKELYFNHCINAGKVAEEKYNWNCIKGNLIRFIDSFTVK